MVNEGDEAELVIEDFRPNFLAHEKEAVYWLTDKGSGLIMVFADRDAVADLYQQIGHVMGWEGDQKKKS